MNVNEAEKFLKNLFTDVWIHGSDEHVSKYFAKDVTGCVNSIPISFVDISNRANYIGKTQKNRGAKFEEILVSDNKIIILKLRYCFTSLTSDKPESVVTMVIYYLNNEIKINKMLIVCETSIDYKATVK